MSMNPKPTGFAAVPFFSSVFSTVPANRRSLAMLVSVFVGVVLGVHLSPNTKVTPEMMV